MCLALVANDLIDGKSKGHNLHGHHARNKPNKQ